jgi:copper(I)-binding protein
VFPPSSSRRIITGLATAALLGAACGSAGDDVEASGAWARPSPMMTDAGAAYMVLSSDEAVTIVSASVPAEVAGRVEIHETVPVGHDDTDTDGDDMDGDGDDMDEGDLDEGDMDEGDMDEGDMDEGDMADTAMMMQPVDSIEIPAGGEVVLAPGGLHLMLLDLPDPLEVGQTFDVTFTEDDGDEFSVTVEVRDEAP